MIAIVPDKNSQIVLLMWGETLYTMCY